MDLHGSTALVTGAGRRLGKAIALSLAEAGADLIVHVHSSATAELVRQIEQLGRRVEVVAGDLSERGGARRLAEEVCHHVRSIEVVVNSAAVFYPTPLRTLSVSEWRKVLLVNLQAPLVLALTLGKVMRAQGKGKIIQLGLEWTAARAQFPSLLRGKGRLAYVDPGTRESTGAAGAGQ